MESPDSTPDRHPFKLHGYLGAGLIAAAELGMLYQHRSAFAFKLSQWATPICWWGYILLVDAVIYRLKGNSLVISRTRELGDQAMLSVLFWLIFEVYNLHLHNWEYRGLPTNMTECGIGMCIAFASIMPGMFQTAELLQTLNVFPRVRISPLREPSNRLIYGWIVVGMLFLIVPLLMPRPVAKYLFAFVWLGFVLVLDPLVYCSGGQSLLSDLCRGTLSRILCLFVGGYICGFLWEFWNYWSAAKWVYLAPFTEDVRIFEMPLAGFLGFGPFAWEYFCMYEFAKLIYQRPEKE